MCNMQVDRVLKSVHMSFDLLLFCNFCCFVECVFVNFDFSFPFETMSDPFFITHTLSSAADI